MSLHDNHNRQQINKYILHHVSWRVCSEIKNEAMALVCGETSSRCFEIQLDAIWTAQNQPQRKVSTWIRVPPRNADGQSYSELGHDRIRYRRILCWNKIGANYRATGQFKHRHVVGFERYWNVSRKSHMFARTALHCAAPRCIYAVTNTTNIAVALAVTKFKTTSRCRPSDEDQIQIQARWIIRSDRTSKCIATATMWVVHALWTMSLFFVFRGTCNMRGMKRLHHRLAICIHLASPGRMG